MSEPTQISNDRSKVIARLSYVLASCVRDFQLNNGPISGIELLAALNIVADERMHSGGN